MLHPDYLNHPGNPDFDPELDIHFRPLGVDHPEIPTNPWILIP